MGDVTCCHNQPCHPEYYPQCHWVYGFRINEGRDTLTAQIYSFIHSFIQETRSEQALFQTLRPKE